jgi:hypothetical protein
VDFRRLTSLGVVLALLVMASVGGLLVWIVMMLLTRAGVDISSSQVGLDGLAILSSLAALLSVALAWVAVLWRKATASQDPPK